VHQSFKKCSTFIFITIISFFSLFTSGYALNAPDAPTGLSASDGTLSGKVQVTWSAVSGAQSYDVYRADMPAWTGTAPKKIASSVAGTTYNDTSASRGNRYYYWVKSISASGVSRYSNFDAGYRGKTGTKPAVPTNVSATNGTASGKVNITWDKTNNTLIYEIWRADIPAFLGGKIKKIGTSANRSYSDATVVAGNRYYYWVKARNSWGVSRYSLFDTGYIGTASLPLSPPANISASEISVSGKVNISWRPISGALVYEVWRATKLVSEGGKPQRVGFLPGTSFDNTSTANNTNYYYWVKARDSWGSSRYSRPVSPGTSIGSGGDPNPSTPGDDCDTAMPLAVNSSYSGTFVTDMDIHFFKITPSSSGTLTVYTTGDTDTLGGILDDDCFLLEDDDDSGNNFNFNMSMTLAAGTYYIATTPAVYDETGPYTLYLSFTGSGSSGGSANPNQVSLELGEEVPIGSSSVGTGNMILTANIDEDPIDGMAISIPPASYQEATTFTVSHSPIISHSGNENFNPVTPLISIENGGEYADEIITVKIPVTIEDGYHYMAFYYDKTTGALEGIPEVDHDSTSLTIATRHFSEILVNRLMYRIFFGNETVDSGFQVKQDNWPFENPVTHLSPGICSGMSIASLYYYNEIKKQKAYPPLFGFYDNGTSDFDIDDDQAIKLCSTIQWWDDNNGIRPSSTDDDLWTYFTFIHAILLSGEPQYVSIYPSGNDPIGHAMVVYKKSGNDLYVSDPNLPEDQNVKIEFEWSSDPLTTDPKQLTGSFKAFESQWNKGSDKVDFTEISYSGTSAFIDSSFGDLWNQLDNGTVPWNKSIDTTLHEDYHEYEFKIIEKDSSGTERESDLTDNYETTNSVIKIKVAKNLR